METYKVKRNERKRCWFDISVLCGVPTYVVNALGAGRLWRASPSCGGDGEAAMSVMVRQLVKGMEKRSLMQRL